MGPFALLPSKPVVLEGLSALLRSAGSGRVLTRAHSRPSSTAACVKEHAGLYIIMSQKLLSVAPKQALMKKEILGCLQWSG